jgi:hypothetical protein
MAVNFNTLSVNCRTCNNRVAWLRNMQAFTPDTRKCHFLARLTHVDATRVYPHHEGENHPFKLGKIFCVECTENLGNIQEFNIHDATETFCALKTRNVHIYNPETQENTQPVCYLRLGPILFGGGFFKPTTIYKRIQDHHAQRLCPDFYDPVEDFGNLAIT